MPLEQANQDLYIVKKPLDEDRMLPTNKKIIHVRLSSYSQVWGTILLALTMMILKRVTPVVVLVALPKISARDNGLLSVQHKPWSFKSNFFPRRRRRLLLLNMRGNTNDFCSDLATLFSWVWLDQEAIEIWGPNYLWHHINDTYKRYGALHTKASKFQNFGCK